jgi:hypothetical protein
VPREFADVVWAAVADRIQSRAESFTVGRRTDA